MNPVDHHAPSNLPSDLAGDGCLLLHVGGLHPLSKVVLEDLDHFQEELKDHACIDILFDDGCQPQVGPLLPGMHDVDSLVVVAEDVQHRARSGLQLYHSLLFLLSLAHLFSIQRIAELQLVSFLNISLIFSHYLCS